MRQNTHDISMSLTIPLLSRFQRVKLIFTTEQLNDLKLISIDFCDAISFIHKRFHKLYYVEIYKIHIYRAFVICDS